MDNKEFVKYGRLTALAAPGDIEEYASQHFMVFEKIDGGNCQVRKPSDFRLVAGSRSNFLRGRRLHWCEWFPKFTRWMRSNTSLYNLLPHLVLFGEWSGNHTIEYAPEYTDKFFVLDVFDLEKNTFIPYPQATRILNELEIKDVQLLPILAEGTVVTHDLTWLLDEPSHFYSGPKEGLVLKAYDADPLIRLKTYHPDFSEKVRLHDGKVFYLTPARFRKNIHRLREESTSGAVAIQQLIAGVVDDILEEERVKYAPDEVSLYFSRYFSEGRLLRAARYLDMQQELL